MANDVCYGEIEGNLINLRVEGLFKGPDLLIWGKFDKKSTSFFQWDLLEEKLNSEYRKIILLENELVKSGQIFSAHHLLFELDEIQFHKAEGKYRYALVDFSRLLSMVRQRPKLRFNWKQFYQDLQSEISQNLQGTHYRLTTLTPGHFVLSLPRESIEKDFARLSAYIKDIEVWRYFNESNMLMNFDISPEVRIVSPASVNIIRQLEDGYIDIMDNTSSRRSRPGPSPSV
jgi:hypothetical protein